MCSEPSDSPSAWRRRFGEVTATARTNTVKAAVVNSWDVWLTLELILCLLKRPARQLQTHYGPRP
jgi:hypothetical protein